ncbi:hypothetical protein HA402_009755 [Bradysia odoriphaga]|nr:hypothetical protein HA402_009755 [Bradysia odoriphaga]
MAIIKGEPVQEQSAKNQYLAALVVSLQLTVYGIVTGWTSPNIELLKSDKSPLPSGSITVQQAAWVGSLLAVGALPGNFINGFLVAKFGRKWPLAATSIPMSVSWLLIMFAQNVSYLYVARLLQGFALGGVLSISPVFLVEIADDRVRGILGSSVPFGGALGILIAFILGDYTDFIVTPICGLVMSVIFFGLFSFFPETPIFLMRQNKIDETEKSLQFYRNVRIEKSNYIKNEIQKLKNAVRGNDTEETTDRSLKLSDFTMKPGRNALIIAAVLALLNQLSGITTMISYTATIFAAAGSTVSPNTSAMIVGILQLIGTLAVTQLVDRFGRRFLYTVSTFGTSLGLVILGAYMMLGTFGVDLQAFNWIPIFAFSYTIFVSALAIQALPIAVTAELMPDKLKEIGVAFAITLLSTASFFVLYFFPILAQFIGFHSCLFFFAVVCLLSGLFLLKFLPETKGKSYEETMSSLR